MTKILLLSLLSLGCSAFAQTPEQSIPPPPPEKGVCPAKGETEKFAPPKGSRNRPPICCGHKMKDPKEMRALVKKARSGNADAIKELKEMILAEMDSHIEMIEKRIEKQGKNLEKTKVMLENFKKDKDIKAQQVLKSILSNEKMGKRCPMGDLPNRPSCEKEGHQGPQKGCCPMVRKNKGPCCDDQAPGPKGRKGEPQGAPKGKDLPPPPPPPPSAEGFDA